MQPKPFCRAFCTQEYYDWFERLPRDALELAEVGPHVVTLLAVLAGRLRSLPHEVRGVGVIADALQLQPIVLQRTPACKGILHTMQA